MSNVINHKICEHDQCLNHEPAWENVGEEFVAPYLNEKGEKRLCEERCCGENVVLFKAVQKQQCTVCERVQEIIPTTYFNNSRVIFGSKIFGLCSCCNKKVEETHGKKSNWQRFVDNYLAD